MLRKLCLLSALIGAGFASWVTAAPVSATATTAYSCHATGGRAIDSSYALANDSTWQDMILRCDAPDGPGDYKSTTSLVSVHGRDGTTASGLSVQACESYRTTGGGRCGRPARSAAARVGHTWVGIQPSLWWNSQANYGYVAIRVPARQGTSRSSVKGIGYSHTHTR